MELIINLLQFFVTLLGFCLSDIRYLRHRTLSYFLLICFYGCFALGSLYWTLYLLLFSETPRIFYVSEFGWVSSVIFLCLLQYTLSSPEERSFSCRKSLLAPLIGVPLCAFYCTFGDILSNLLWCGMMILVLSFHPRSCLRRDTDGKRTEPAVFSHRNPLLCCDRIRSVDLRLLLAGRLYLQSLLLV